MICNNNEKHCEIFINFNFVRRKQGCRFTYLSSSNYIKIIIHKTNLIQLLVQNPQLNTRIYIKRKKNISKELQPTEIISRPEQAPINTTVGDFLPSIVRR